MTAAEGGVSVASARSLWMARGRDRASIIDFSDFYAAHYLTMVRLAGFLLGNSDGAEDIAQDAFVKIAASSLRDPDRAVAYMRQIVVNDCRQLQRHQQVIEKHAWREQPPRNVASAEESTLAAFDRHRLVAALRTLSPRKREVVVLRHYCDLSEGTVASMLSISVGAVKSIASRGLADLAKALEGRR